MYRFYSEVLLHTLISMNRLPKDIMKYFWSEDFIQSLKKEEIDDVHTGVKLTLYDAFRLGLNIGTCNLTSRYLMRFINDYQNLKMVYGSCDVLKGTEKYNCGLDGTAHVWIEYPKKMLVVDTTLMLCMPRQYAYNVLGYNSVKVLADEAASYFDDCDEYQEYPKIIGMSSKEKEKYYEQLLAVK